MLSHLRVSNFQSLTDVRLDLGRLTVVVGASSSGKSAVARAIKLALQNARGTSYVTRGQRTAAVSFTVPGTGVAVKRGEGVSEYSLTDLAMAVDKDPAATTVWTKCSSSTPAEVSQAVGVPSDAVDLHVAGQFDRPFLLTEAGSEVAAVLGRLTNVDRLIEAAREGGRLRLQASQLLRTRQEDLAAVSERVRAYVDLPAKLAALREAESLAGAHSELERRLQRLRELESAARLAATALAQVRVPPEPPDLAPLEQLSERHHSLRAATLALLSAQEDASSAAASVDEFTAEESRAAQHLREVLRSAGTCPTCGQSTSAMEPVSAQ